MNKKNIIILLVIASAALLTVGAWLYQIIIYPYSFSENVYEKNSNQFEKIVDLFKKHDNAFFAKIDKDGHLTIKSSAGTFNFDCTSDEGYKALIQLRQKYKAKNYTFDNICAEYDDKHNMTLKIPVYVRILDNDASVDGSNRIVYYVLYSDSEPKIKGRKIKDNWYVTSDSVTAG